MYLPSSRQFPLKSKQPDHAHHAVNGYNPFTFVGEYGYQYDNILWYQVRRRYYAPIIGRWLSKDTIQEHRDYSYVQQNPVLFADPSGLLRSTVPRPQKIQNCPNSTYNWTIEWLLDDGETDGCIIQNISITWGSSQADRI